MSMQALRLVTFEKSTDMRKERTLVKTRKNDKKSNIYLRKSIALPIGINGIAYIPIVEKA